LRCKGTTFFGKKNVLPIFLQKKDEKYSFIEANEQKAPFFILK